MSVVGGGEGGGSFVWGAGVRCEVLRTGMEAVQIGRGRGCEEGLY